MSQEQEERTTQTEAVLELLTPITAPGADGVKITSLTIKEPTAGQMAFAEQNASKKGGNELMIHMLGFACGLHPNVIRNLKARDFNRASKALGDFLEDGQSGG